jgi:hypothetical protein
MRLIVASLVAVFIGVGAARADTVWNVKVPARDGGSTTLRTIAGDPNVFLAGCPCVAGVWRIASKGETATHFVGTIDAPSFNHPRKSSKSLRAKVRKTRSLMGVHRDYRAKLHGILRGSGHVVLREVAGGEWEIAGFAEEPAADLFKARENWRAATKPRLPKPTPFVNASADSADLAKLINDYRASIRLPRVPISPALTKVAQAHVRDLNANKPVRDGCNMHSWSDKGGWSACCYDSSKEAARCMWKKPKEIAGHKGNGYEIAANASGITAEQALVLWQNSAAHHAVMINKDQWKDPWRALGVAVEGDFAVAWFSDKAE